MFEDKSLGECLDVFASPTNGRDHGRPVRDVSGATITLGAVCSADEPLLYRTYASTRAAELKLTGWNSEMRETFLRLQYDAQRRSYGTQFPNAEYWVIRRDDTGIGRLIIEESLSMQLLPALARG